ncbi:MAG: redoxin domain-containing protein, partial [Pirellulales bacterium]
MGQSRRLGASLSDFENAGAEVCLIVPHERCRVRWWSEKSGKGLTVLADPGFWVSSLYGVAFQMRIHTDTSNTPGTFVIDPQGVLR